MTPHRVGGLGGRREGGGVLLEEERNMTAHRAGR